MSERDAALLARSAAALRAEGKDAEADRLDAVVARIRREDAATTTPAADLDGVRNGTFQVRDVDEHPAHPVPRPPRRRPSDSCPSDS